MDSEEEIEKIIEEKVEERVESRIQEELEKRGLKREKKPEKQQISRRSFLKKIGIGAAGLGVLSLSPVTGNLKITDNGIKKNGSPTFLDLAGTNMMSGDLDMNNYRITNLSSPSNSSDAATRDYVDTNVVKDHNNLSNITSDDHHGTSVDHPVYQSLGDVPNLSEGEVVYVADEGGLFVEDGT